jgi:alginate O-acetyltransferase complex protein AlgI
MAIGLALLLGFRLPANFAHPYRALSLTEFWRRWHISLSQWFRDYVYLPLGGNRVGSQRALVNLFVVFVLSGLWHGAGVNFVVWGAIHGAVLIVEKLLGSKRDHWPAWLRWSSTFTVVMVAWAFFRLNTQHAWLLVKRASPFGNWSLSLDSYYYVLPIWGFLTLLVLEHCLPYYQVNRRGNPVLPGTLLPGTLLPGALATTPTPRRVYATLAAVSAAFLIALLISGRPLPFIYFNF